MSMQKIIRDITKLELYSSGHEIVRIDNKKDDDTLIIAESGLQDKSGRYYFIDTMNLGQR